MSVFPAEHLCVHRGPAVPPPPHLDHAATRQSAKSAESEAEIVFLGPGAARWTCASDCRPHVLYPIDTV